MSRIKSTQFFTLCPSASSTTAIKAVGNLSQPTPSARFQPSSSASSRARRRRFTGSMRRANTSKARRSFDPKRYPIAARLVPAAVTTSARKSPFWIPCWEKSRSAASRSATTGGNNPVRTSAEYPLYVRIKRERMNTRIQSSASREHLYGEQPLADAD